MKIEYIPPDGGKALLCGFLSTASFVVVAPGAACPTCAHLIGLRDARGRLVALARRERLAEAKAEIGGELTEEPPDGVFRVQLVEAVEGHDLTGAARCIRCKEVHGRLRVTFHTIFGAEEDRAVLCGRARVY